ncbi:hypothetical protein OXYTRIMIC_581 [Oxytricha trifallax]|uniref:Secreted protein n=1 Tax=Oxytricha trifallax TaxID=1172189 RepID=A0A073HZ48_9SPIT|nr:hypothetical protein OXYTRIMIC_581 [Oxytricha trifallax]
MSFSTCVSAISSAQGATLAAWTFVTLIGCSQGSCPLSSFPCPDQPLRIPTQPGHGISQEYPQSAFPSPGPVSVPTTET